MEERIKEKRITPSYKRKVGKYFIKGPLPLDWIITAAKLPGKVLHVALVMWYLAGLKKSYTFKLSGAKLRSFGISRQSSYRAVDALEKVGLIEVTRKRGQNPEIKIKGANENEN